MLPHHTACGIPQAGCGLLHLSCGIPHYRMWFAAFFTATLLHKNRGKLHAVSCSMVQQTACGMAGSCGEGGNAAGCRAVNRGVAAANRPNPRNAAVNRPNTAVYRGIPQLTAPTRFYRNFCRTFTAKVTAPNRKKYRTKPHHTACGKVR